VIPGTVGLPSMIGFPETITFVETVAPGAGIAVAVVHGLLAGEGGTGHVHGFAEMSPAHRAGAPPTMTFICLGIRTTGPLWQQVITALMLTAGGMAFPCAKAPRSIAAPSLPDNHPFG
jgi:hypothetical protein